jgi:hypothetical protein
MSFVCHGELIEGILNLIVTGGNMLEHNPTGNNIKRINGMLSRVMCS